MAYLDGVAEAMTATRGVQRPLALVVCTSPPTSGIAPCSVPAGMWQPAGNESTCAEPYRVVQRSSGTRITLRHGEIAIAIERTPMAGLARATPVVLPGPITRGGARLLDLGQADEPALGGAPYRDTLPYGIVTLSLSPRYMPPVARFEALVGPSPTVSVIDESTDGVEVHTSDVYLRCAPLAPEWYDLTGTDNPDRNGMNARGGVTRRG